ncbi:MAG: cache domain-containing protein [Thermodesulforhabdaceae bacterium]
MKKLSFLMVIGLFLSLLSVSALFAGEKAPPEEVVQKVREAAQFLAKEGNKALEEFNKKDGKWVWKDSYIYVVDCAQATVLAHPMQPQLIGKNVIAIKDAKGKLFSSEICEAAKNPKGGWVEYWWPKPGEQTPSRKLSYSLNVEGTNHAVVAGIYDDQSSVEDLNKSLK